MSGTPKWKIFDSHGKYQAACKEIEAAAALIGFYGDGATIRSGHSKSEIVWTEGGEDQSAFESYDYVAEVGETRELKRNAQALMRAYGEAWVRDALKKRGYGEDLIAEALAA